MWRSAAKAAGGLVGGTAVLGFAADYATMSPFRRDWRVGDALLVGYNQLLRRTPAGDVLLQEFDLAELSAFSGRAGAPTYLSAGGCVWDVSSSRDSFGIGGPYEIFAGRDASVALAYMRIEERDANCVDQFATLRADPEAAESLESWRTYFDQKYRRVGVLREWVRQEPNLTGTARRCLQRNASRPAVTVLPSGVQYETLAAAQTARAGAGTTVGRGLSRGAQDMVLAHYCVRGVDGTVVSDSASVEDGRPLILAVRDLPPEWLEGMQGMAGGGEKRRIWVPPPQPGVRGPPPQTQTVVVDMEVVRWLPGGEGSALREERHREVVVEQEEEERVAEAMRVAGRLAST